MERKHRKNRETGIKKTDDKETDVFQIFQNIARHYDRSNAIISVGLHGYWKFHMVHCLSGMVPERGTILDLCCGTGDISRGLLKEKKNFIVTGADFSPNMLALARKKLAGFSSFHLVRADAMELPWKEGTFDAVVISFGLRNTPDPEQVIREMVRVTKKGGIVCIMDAHYPDHPWVRKGFSLYFHQIMPLLGGGKKNQKEYQWLNYSTKNFAHWKEIMEMMKTAGLVKQKYKRFLFGSCVYQLGLKG